MTVIEDRARSIFLRALDSAPDQWPAFLDVECGDNPELRVRVDQLLQAHQALGSIHGGVESPMATIDSPSVTERPGSLIGPYKLKEQIGEGGFGLVFVAEQQEPVKRKVALKVIKPGMDTREVMARFTAERQALALMDHPNIARVLDAGATDSGRPYFVMELVRGIPITDYCDQNQLAPRDRLDLFITVCQAVQHAHQKGIIHRDIKPSNVLVTSHDGKPVAKVIDFGVAKAINQQLTERSIYTQFTQMIGTPLYMSPEQAEMSGLDIDTRSDIYSLGVLLYELLTGTTPFDKKRFAKAAYDEIRRLIREEEPPKPSMRLSTSDSIASIAAQRHMEPAKLSKLMRGDLDWITMKALEKDRTRRYETANGLARDIERYLSDEPVEACPPSATYRLRKFARKNRAALTTAAAIALLLVASVAVSTWQAVRATNAEAAARVAELNALQAQRAETERAEGERLAKLDAQAQRAKAEQAAANEKAANAQAQKRLTQIQKANDILGSIFESLDPKEIAKGERPLQAILVEKLDKAVAQLEGESIGDPLVVAAMQEKFGSSLLGLGEPGKAIALLEKARATREAKLGPEHPDTLTSMNNLAVASQDAGKLDLALPLFEETLKLRKAKLGPGHSNTLSSMNNLALAYQDAGKLDLAVRLFEETLKLRKAKLGPGHPNTLTSMNNLALAYQAAGKLDLALPLFEEALKLRKAKLGPEHPDTLQSMNNLALAYQAAGKLDLALPLLEETLKLRKAKLGPEHPDTLISMNSLALTYQAAGKLDLALPLYEETLKLSRAKLGPEHPLTLAGTNNLAAAYKAAGKLDLAVRLFEETLKLRKAKLGPEHPDTLQSMNNLALAHQAVGKLNLALLLLQETLKVSKAKLGPEHPDTLTIMNNLALAYQAAGKLDLALPLLEETLKLRKAKLGPEHPDTLSSMNSLTSAYDEVKQFDKAEVLHRERLPLLKQKLGGDSPAYAGALAALGLNLLHQEKWTEAEPLLRECVAIREKQQPDAWTTFNTKSLLGGALLGQKKYADAEPLIVSGYEGMKQREKTIPPEGTTRIPEALDRLIELYTATNKPDEVKKWQAEGAKYPAVKK